MRIYLQLMQINGKWLIKADFSSLKITLTWAEATRFLTLGFHKRAAAVIARVNCVNTLL